MRELAPTMVWLSAYYGVAFPFIKVARLALLALHWTELIIIIVTTLNQNSNYVDTRTGFLVGRNASTPLKYCLPCLVY